MAFTMQLSEESKVGHGNTFIRGQILTLYRKESQNSSISHGLRFISPHGLPQLCGTLLTLSSGYLPLIIYLGMSCIYTMRQHTS